MRILMVITSVVAFYINKVFSNMKYSNKDDIDFEQPLTNLVWITSILSIMCYFCSKLYYDWTWNSCCATVKDNLWFVLAIIISCGTLGAALIPEFTKIFTSPKSTHVQEVVTASREGGRFIKHSFRFNRR